MNATTIDLIPGMFLNVPRHAAHALEVVGTIDCRFIEGLTTS